MASWVAGGMTGSAVPTSAHDGMSAQAGGPDGWPRMTVEAGRWVAARTAAFRARLRSPSGLVRPFQGGTSG
jgi:hypothetical protein